MESGSPLQDLPIESGRCASGFQPEVLGFPLGTLDTDPKVKATRHVFVGSKAPWFDITDDLPQHQEY